MKLFRKVALGVAMVGLVGTACTQPSTPSPPKIPTVVSIDPTSGPEAGGTEVTITGTNLTGATEVAFGGTPAAEFEVVSNTEISATSPAGTGDVLVSVTTPKGTSALNEAAEFTYEPPVVEPDPTGMPVNECYEFDLFGQNYSTWYSGLSESPNLLIYASIGSPCLAASASMTVTFVPQFTVVDPDPEDPWGVTSYPEADAACEAIQAGYGPASPLWGVIPGITEGTFQCGRSLAVVPPPAGFCLGPIVYPVEAGPVPPHLDGLSVLWNGPNGASANAVLIRDGEGDAPCEGTPESTVTVIYPDGPFGPSSGQCLAADVDADGVYTHLFDAWSGAVCEGTFRPIDPDPESE